MTLRYCWWKNSCTGCYGNHPVIFMVLYIPGSCLGCLPSTVSSGMWWLLDFMRGRLPPSHLLHTSTSEVCSWDPKVLLEEKAAKKNKTPLIRLLTTRQLKHLWYNYQQTTPFNGEATKNMKETMTSPELFRLALNGQSFSTLNFLNTHDGSMGLE